MHFVHLANTLLKDEESARDNQILACIFAKYSPIKKIFTDQLAVDTVPHQRLLTKLQ